MLKEERKKYSKFLSLILRHHPEVANLTLDSHGWAAIDNLLINLNITKADIIEIVENDSKGRYIISKDGKSIRANYGHSIDVNLNLKITNPPLYLYHGTSIDNIDSIMEKGILSMQRQYVHLSQNYDTALKVGLRHGEAIVLKISAQEMVHNGMEFFKSENGIYLTKYVPNNYITVLENAKLKIKQKKLWKK